MLLERLIILEYINFIQDKGFLYKVYIDTLEKYEYVYYDDLFKKLRENNYDDLCSKLNMIKGQEGTFIYSVKTKELNLLKKEKELLSVNDDISIENIKKAELYNSTNDVRNTNNNVFVSMQRDMKGLFNFDGLKKSNSTLFSNKNSNSIDLTKFQKYKDLLKKKIKN